MQENKQEKSPIKQNILRYLASKGVSPYDFYRNSGVTRGILTQKNGISEENIARFLDYAPDVNIEWLMTGRGNMYKSGIKDLESMRTDNPKEGIPLIPFGVSAGTLSEVLTAMEDECERFVIPKFRHADFLMEINGDSMLPKFHSGDIVACKWISSLDFNYGNIYVFDTQEGAVIKLATRSAEEGYIDLVSINPDYKTIHLDVEDIIKVAAVIGTLRTETVR